MRNNAAQQHRFIPQCGMHVFSCERRAATAVLLDSLVLG
jgi:hypothetical protein